MVSASPAKAATAIVLQVYISLPVFFIPDLICYLLVFLFMIIYFMCLVIFMAFCACQAERQLQPWIAKDDDQGQKMWRINQRIIKLIVELMRNHDTPESLVVLASALDLLLRATDGMLVDGEACTLPQLEVTMQLSLYECCLFSSLLIISQCSLLLTEAQLLEATARAVKPVLEWGESGLSIADGLSNLLKVIDMVRSNRVMQFVYVHSYKVGCFVLLHNRCGVSQSTTLQSPTSSLALSPIDVGPSTKFTPFGAQRPCWHIASCPSPFRTQSP